MLPWLIGRAVTPARPEIPLPVLLVSENNPSMESRADFMAAEKNTLFLVCAAEKELHSLLAAYPLPENTVWVYLGADYSRLMRLEKGELKNFRRIPISEKLQAAFRQLRTPFLDWLDRLGRDRASLAWWAGTITDRNPAKSPLMQNLCYLKLALELIRANEDKAILVIADSAGVLKELAEAAGGRPVAAIGGWEGKTVRDFFRNEFEAFRFLAHYLIRAFRELRCTGNNPPPREEKQLNPRQVMFLTYTDNNALPGPDSGLKDRYFGVLPDWLAGQGYQVSWLMFIHKWSGEWSEAVRRARLSGKYHYLLHDSLHFIDFLRAALRNYWFWTWKRRRCPSFEGLSVKALLAEEQLRFRSLSYVPDRLVFLDAMRRLASLRPSLKLFIYPFENMSWEKIFCLGVRRYFPDAKLVGFQHTTLSPSMLNYFPTAYEWSSGMTPDLVVCAGREFYEILRGAGYPAERLRLGCSLRYESLGRLLDKKTEKGPGDGKNILVSFSHYPAESLQLLDCVLEAFRDYPDFTVWLKPHPTMLPKEKLLALLPSPVSLPEHFQVVGGNFLDWLSRCGIFLYTSTSSVYEAIALGVPAIHLASENTIDQDSLTLLYGSSDCLRTVSGPEELREAALELAQLGEDRRSACREWGRKVAERVFEPVTEAGLLAFIPQDLS